MKKLTSPLLLIALTLQLLGCGGGGGGGGDAESGRPAEVEASVDINKIDTGDRTTATIFISNVNKDGIMLKIRTPVGLDYVTDSGYLTISGASINVDPTFNKTDATNNYLVYFFSRSIFGEENYGELSVQFQGSKAVAEGKIEVDPDINDLTVADSAEFNVADPKFSAEASAKIKVMG